jgi:hypothetical protein
MGDVNGAGMSRRKRITKLGQKVADEIAAENPPADKQYTRAELMKRAGLKRDEEDSRVEMDFFVALNERLKDSCGRMYVVAGPGKVTFTAREETVSVSEALANREADRALGRHIHTAEVVSKHLDAQGRAEAAESIARVANLAAQIRRSEANAAKSNGGAK